MGETGPPNVSRAGANRTAGEGPKRDPNRVAKNDAFRPRGEPATGARNAARDHHAIRARSVAQRALHRGADRGAHFGPRTPPRVLERAGPAGGTQTERGTRAAEPRGEPHRHTERGARTTPRTGLQNRSRKPRIRRAKQRPGSRSARHPTGRTAQRARRARATPAGRPKNTPHTADSSQGRKAASRGAAGRTAAEANCIGRPKFG